MARTLPQLILLRGVQGLGGGGIIVSTQASLGNIVPAHDRGRYQGIFGAVFGVSSIAGPLLGGFFTRSRRHYFSGRVVVVPPAPGAAGRPTF